MVPQRQQIRLMAKKVFLEFEKELGDINARIEALENEEIETGKSDRAAMMQLQREMTAATARIYEKLTPWQTALVARHPNRPYTMDYIEACIDDFHELHGDRQFADDESIIGGLGRLGEHPVMVIGHQKGRDTRERARRNFGMSRPEGYRKALRLMKLAEKFGIPVLTFVDTPGAYPGIGAEERNQSEAIGRNILEMSKLNVPVITTVIGEGGSGGALAIAVADVVLMLQYATYSVISPEGCASILWKSAEKASTAADALGLTSGRLLELGLVDKVIPEPLGGAHRDPKLMTAALKKALIDELRKVMPLTVSELRERRLQRLLNYGRFTVEGGAKNDLPVLEVPVTLPETQAEATEAAAKADPAEKPEKPVKKTARTNKKPTVKKTAAKKTVKKAVKAADAESTTAADESKKPVRRRTKKTTDVTDESKAE